MANFDGNVDKKINDKFEAIEGKLRNSFQSMKADINSVKQKIAQNSQHKLSSNMSDEIRKDVEFLKEKISAKLGDINSQISELKDVQRQQQERKTPREKGLEELSRQISSLKEQIASKDELETLKIILEDKVQNLKKQLSKTGLKEEIYSELDKKVSETLSSYDNTIYLYKSQSEKDKKETITSLEKEKEEQIKKLEQEKKELINTANNNTEKIVNDTREEIARLKRDISKNTDEIDKKLEERDQQIYTLQRQISYLKSKLKETSQPVQSVRQAEEQKQLVEANKEVSIPLTQRIKDSRKKILAVAVSILLVIVIVGAVILFVNMAKTKYSPFDVVVSNSTGMPMNIYYNQNKIGYLGAFESRLIYNTEEREISGDNTTGWFSNNSIISVTEKVMGSKKFVNAELTNGTDGVLIAVYNYTLFKNKPYFKIQLYTNTLNNNNLSLAAYGFIISGYDILLPDGRVLKNDNNVTTINNITTRSGSIYKIDSSWYEIFYNNNTRTAILTYSPQAIKFDNSFYLNVFRIYTAGANGVYNPVYLMVFDNSTFTFDYELNQYYVGSEQYTGNLDNYIKDSASAMGK